MRLYADKTELEVLHVALTDARASHSSIYTASKCGVKTLNKLIGKVEALLNKQQPSNAGEKP